MTWYNLTNDPCDNSCPNDADQVMANFAYRLENMLPLDNVGAETGDTYNLGSNTYKWKHGYFNEEIFTPCIPPIGSIIPFYDFDGGLTFDSNYWAYCDGSSKTVGDIGAQTLPDLSNRYLVGFGTEGGGDIDSAAWATVAVGNASHQINLQHSHTVDNHTHDVDIGSFASGAGTAHSHTVGTLQFTTANYTYNGATDSHLLMYDSNGSASNMINSLQASNSNLNLGYICQFAKTYSFTAYTKDGTGSVASESSHTHSVNPPNTTSAGATPGTDNQLSSPQSIQPRSIRVRFIMRIK